MEWNGRELRSPPDWTEALAALETREDARRFRDLAVAEYGRETADRNIGYVTGYMAHDVGTRVQELTGVQHPIFGDLWGQLTPEEILTLGIEFQKAQLDGQEFGQAAATARDTILKLRALRGEG